LRFPGSSEALLQLEQCPTPAFPVARAIILGLDRSSDSEAKSMPKNREVCCHPLEMHYTVEDDAVKSER
jgi:hypothetical protein